MTRPLLILLAILGAVLAVFIPFRSDMIEGTIPGDGCDTEVRKGGQVVGHICNAITATDGVVRVHVDSVQNGRVQIRKQTNLTGRSFYSVVEQ